MPVWQRLFGGRSASEPVAPAIVPEVLPILRLLDTVMFPAAVLPLELVTPAELALVEAPGHGDRLVFVVTDDYRVGTVARIVKVEQTPRGYSILVHGIERRETVSAGSSGVLTTPHPTTGTEFKEKADLTARLRALAMNLGRRLPEFREKAERTIVSTDDSEHLTDFIVGNLDAPLDTRHRVLATSDLRARMGAACVCLDELLERLPAPGGPAAPECPAHGALAKSSCKSCGHLACATCLGGDDAWPLCQACRRREKAPQKAAAVLLDGWTVPAVEWFTFAHGHPPPRRGAWALQLGTDIRSRKMQLALAAAVVSLAAGLLTQRFAFTGLGLALVSGYLFLLVSVVSGLRDSPVRVARIRVLAPHPTYPAMRIAIGRLSDGKDVSVVLPAEPAQTMLRQHPELDALFLHQPRSQYHHVLGIRPTGPALPPDQPARTGWRSRSPSDLVVSAVALSLFALVFLGGRVPARPSSLPQAAPVAIEEWTPIVKELQRRGVSPQLTVLTLTCWDLELSSGKLVGGRFEHALVTTAEALGVSTRKLASDVVGLVGTESLAEAAVLEARAVRPKLDGLPGVRKVGQLVPGMTKLVVIVARRYATRHLIPLPRIAEPSPEWAVLLEEVKTHDAVALIHLTRSTHVTLASGSSIEPLNEEAAIETVAAVTGLDITALRADSDGRILAEALNAGDGDFPTLVKAREALAQLAVLPGVARAEPYVQPPPPPRRTPYNPGDPILPAPWARHSEPPSSMRWRMGAGEDLLHNWIPFWRGLPAAEKHQYLSEHPPPAVWAEWMTRVFDAAPETSP